MSEAKKQDTTGDALLQLVSFAVGEEEYGVDILKVQEIIRLVSITQVPNSPHYVDGIINLRGKVIPIIDLRTRIGIPRKEHNNGTRIIVVDLEGKTVGFVVDSVSEVLRIPVNVTEAPPVMTTGADSSYITSVAKLEDRIIILLDLDKVLSDDEKAQLQ
jgi:purine-binding chemotaxis protein CheW